MESHLTDKLRDNIEMRHHLFFLGKQDIGVKELTLVLLLIYTKVFSDAELNIGISCVQILREFGSMLLLSMIDLSATVALLHGVKQALLSTTISSICLKSAKPLHACGYSSSSS